MTTSELIAELIESLKKYPRPSMQALHDLGMALHDAMSDYPEMLWMEHTFEDVAGCMKHAEECARIDTQQAEADHERKVQLFRLNGGL